MTASEGDWTNREYEILWFYQCHGDRVCPTRHSIDKTRQMVRAAEELLRAGETVAFCVHYSGDTRFIKKCFSDIGDFHRWERSRSLFIVTPDSHVRFIGRRIGTLFIHYSVVEVGGYTTKLRNFVEAVSPRVGSIVWG